MKDWLKARFKEFLATSASFKLAMLAAVPALFIGGCIYGTLRSLVGTEPVAQGETYSFGWEDRPEYVKAQVATFAKPFFGDAAKHLITADLDKDAFLWQAVEKCTGNPWEPHDQDGTGCCVGEGSSAAVEIVSAVEIAMNGEMQEYRPISAAAVYALARQVGGNLGGGDGSTGSDAAKALMTLGAIACDEASDTNGRQNTSHAHADLARKWGSHGLPDSLKEIARKHLVKTASLVRTPEEVKAALINGYPVFICSSVGFTGRNGFKRDADGFCWPGGTWPHCMCICGYRMDKKAFLVLQSWGANAPPGPKTLGQPDGSFWIDWSACQRVVRANDSYAVSSFDGYPQRALPFFIKAKPREDVITRLNREFRFALAP